MRAQVIALLRGGQAYDTFDSILAEFTPEERGIIPQGGEHSAWQILEHLRIALRDILDYSQNEKGDYREMAWPDEYWPREVNGDWDETIRAYKAGLAEMEALVQSRDLLQPFPWEPKHALLREALLAADHASYHLGQLVELKRWVSAKD